MNRRFTGKLRLGSGAFTLLEVLIVFTTICVLVALLMGAMGAIRERTDQVRCAGNLRSYSIKAVEYAADNNGAIAVLDDQGHQFQRFLPNYPDYSYTPKWVCPSFVALKKERNDGIAPNPLTIWWTGYNSNRYFADRSGVAGEEKKNGYKTPGTWNQIASPSKTPLYFCVDTDGNDAAGGYIRDGNGRWHYRFWSAHRGGFNIIFFDGHAEWVPFNVEGVDEGISARDYSQFIWKPY